jgi:hypothetical protein
MTIKYKLKLNEIIENKLFSNHQYSKEERQSGVNKLKQHFQSYKLPTDFEYFLNNVGYLANYYEIYSSLGIFKLNVEENNYPNNYLLIANTGGDIYFFLNLTTEKVEGFFPGLPILDPRNLALRDSKQYPKLNFQSFEEYFNHFLAE